MDSNQTDAREVILVRGLFTAEDSQRARELVKRSEVNSVWHVEIRTAGVLGTVVRQASLGTFPTTDCICLDLKLSRAVPVEPGLRFYISSVEDESLRATGVVRPWD
ncbi:MAG: hypothetical protein RJA81_2030 [Planctomycetota bacterium]|jgi:hypothetical protein